MSDDDDDNDYNGDNRIDASLGDLEVTVVGQDESWVTQTFEEVWYRRLEEAETMKEALRESDTSTY